MYWILGALVVLGLIILVYVVFGGGSSSAAGYTRGHGYCPNMGACNDCNVCEGD